MADGEIQVEDLTPADRRIRIAAFCIVGNYAETRDLEVREPLVAMTRRCLEVVAGVRRPAAHSGLPVSRRQAVSLITHEVVLEADQDAKLDLSAQAMLAKMAGMPDPAHGRELVDGAETTSFPIPFLGEAGLELYRVTLPEESLARYTLHNVNTVHTD